MNDEMKWWGWALNALVAAIVMLILGAFAARGARTRNPGRLQLAFEAAFEGLRSLYLSILGAGGEGHLPFVFALFFFILFCNLIGFIPFFHSPTANLSTTLALALLVFFYVQFTGIRSKGILGYLRHFLGPLLFLAPLFIIIEVVGELAKPVSLSFRLYGNIFGEDVINNLVTTTGNLHFGPAGHQILVPIPFQFFVYLLQLFTDILQAFIFTLLTCAYISIMSASHHGEDEGHKNGETRAERVEDNTALASTATT